MDVGDVDARFLELQTLAHRCLLVALRFYWLTQEPAYAASKGAIRIFTKVTASQHAVDKIRCNSVTRARPAPFVLRHRPRWTRRWSGCRPHRLLRDPEAHGAPRLQGTICWLYEWAPRRSSSCQCAVRLRLDARRACSTMTARCASTAVAIPAPIGARALIRRRCSGPGPVHVGQARRVLPERRPCRRAAQLTAPSHHVGRALSRLTTPAYGAPIVQRMPSSANIGYLAGPLAELPTPAAPFR